MKKEGLLYGLIFLLVLVATTTGVFYHTPESCIESLTVRGQHAVFQGSGLYRYDPCLSSARRCYLGRYKSFHWTAIIRCRDLLIPAEYVTREVVTWRLIIILLVCLSNVCDDDVF